ncbi:hypothetical protein T492DRAFT_995368 [Pavlovales sp. CCMP2436]|nr:hypothetical protein T492DRAFT_995368 [Pavlovales sp. CCMP2436]
MLAPRAPVEPLDAAAIARHEAALERHGCHAAVANAQRRGARPGSARMPAPTASHRLHGDIHGCLRRVRACGRTRRTCAGLVPRAARTPFGPASGAALRASGKHARPCVCERGSHPYLSSWMLIPRTRVQSDSEPSVGARREALPTRGRSARP